MSTETSDEILSKEQYERRRTPRQLSEYVGIVDSRLRELEKVERHRACEKGIGKKFIKEMRPLSLFAQTYFRGHNDISLEARLGDQSFDAQIFKGEQELCKIEVTEAINGLKWAWQRELLLENGWAPGTGTIECATRRHNRKKGDIRATSECIEDAQLVQEELSLIEKALDNKFDKSNKASGLYGRDTWLLVAFNDTTALHPDQLKSDDKSKLRDTVRRKIRSLNPSFAKVFLVGWSGKSLYEFSADNV